MLKKISMGILLTLFVSISLQSSSLSKETKEQIIKEGNAISKSLVKLLGSELSNKIKSSGFSGAVSFCSVNALSLTEDLSKKLSKQKGYMIKIKRTALKYRNSKNAPTDEETKVLKKFEKMKNSGVNLAKEVLVQKIDDHYKYYKPLLVVKKCTICHGSVSAIPKGIKSIISKKCPNDKACNFKVGDLRGVIAIEFYPKDY